MHLRVAVTSPLPPETWFATVHLEGGGQEVIRVEDGWFEGEVAGTARSVAFSLVPLAGARGSSTPAPDPLPPPVRDVDATELFTGPDQRAPGYPVPEDGRVDLRLLWLAPCDGIPHVLPEGSRFGSYEHTLCAELVGKDARGGPLEIAGIVAHFDDRTELGVGGKPLRFGTIIAMAGDYYAHLDDEAARDFAWAWPGVDGLRGFLAGDYRATTLAGDDRAGVDAIDDHIHREAAGGQVGLLAAAIEAAATRFAVRRYLALASQNICHFACQVEGYSARDNPALALYRAYHARAIREARAAGEARDRDAFDAALVVDAFGCHFLTDLFASGHIRVPRGVLARRFGVAAGALAMSKWMHDEDNHAGLWVTTLARAGDRRVVWRAYGDDALQRDEARVHLAQVQEAVRRSVAEVFAVYAAARLGLAPEPTPRAEEMVPVPLPPGELPDPATDVSPDGCPLPDHPPNHRPMFTLLEDGRVARRVLGSDLPVEMPAPEGPPAPGIVVP